VSVRQSREDCQRPCDNGPVSVAEQCESTRRRDGKDACESQRQCVVDARCETEQRREKDEWCERPPSCEERPPCDSVPTVASYERCESRPACDVKQQCDPYPNGAKSTRGKEYCDPCENTDVRKRGDRGESCEVRACETRDRCEPKQRCDTTPRCDDNVPAAARENGAKQSSSVQAAANLSSQPSADTAQRVAQAVEKSFGDTKFMKQIAHLL